VPAFSHQWTLPKPTAQKSVTAKPIKANQPAKFSHNAVPLNPPHTLSSVSSEERQDAGELAETNKHLAIATPHQSKGSTTT
ncbi:MAG: hypothetical protein AAF889_06290, partial [Cyanobacteria bacterium P01_D01_bin.73]